MNHTVLVVDDEPSVLKSIRRQLIGEPYEVLLAESGESALEILRARCISLIVTDMRMPGMDGVTFLREVAGICPHSVRMVLSGYAEVSSILEAINEGHVWRYITKPWKGEDLKVAIRNAIDLWESEAERRRLLEELRHANDELRELNDHLEEKVRARTRELETRAAILQLILDDAPLPEIAERALALMREVAGAEAAVVLEAPGLPAGTPDPRDAALARRALEADAPLAEADRLALPLAKGGVRLGAVVLRGGASAADACRKALESAAGLLIVALHQEKMLADAPGLVGEIDRLLEETG
jgi:CheY-like chemotaxis protein